jgi:hypothetical protein
MNKLLTTETLNDEKVGFLLGMAEAIVGGSPALGVSEDHGDYIVVATCTCGSCDEFRLTMEKVASTSVVLAIKHYVESRILFINKEENKNETRH